MKQHKLFYGSSYDRGLEHLLKMWPEIISKYPDAELHICYGWDLFTSVLHNNPERMEWKDKMVELMKQKGIIEHGRVGKQKLQEIRKSCGIWAYPTEFTEINCITALESQADGLVPVTIAYAALTESVGSGVLVNGDIYDKETKDTYLKELLSMMGNGARWKQESKKAKKFAKDYDWSKIASKWNHLFIQKDESVKVTIYTPTVRRGFWNIMAKNISEQTYKNIEWVIVDDHVEDRSKIAQEYASKYKVDIKYLKGKSRKVKRTYGLVNANNTALNVAEGELFVFLQDFILIPHDGIEQLVTLYKKNSQALIAPCDMYVTPRIKPDIKSEDWFHGETDVVGKFIRQNIRIKNMGLRKTENPYEFEQNYGALPTKIARDLGGWYEFMDEGLGYDNTDIAARALMKGYEIIVDETNVAICIDHWDALKHDRGNVIGRARALNDPRYVWETEVLKNGSLPVVRTQEVDDKIELLYDIPEDVTDEQVVKWIDDNGGKVVENWLSIIKL